MKENPELLPVEEFGLTGPLLVVGEETTLPSGAADLVGLARGGDLVIIEFKTGPQNPDFRRASAQLLDYGSDLWGMSFEEFESSVATRFFSSGRCRDARVAGSKSLKDAASTVWDDFSEDDWDSCKEQLTQRLTSGAFRFVLAAQRFTDSAGKTLEYLNEVSQGPSFYGVEMVRFTGDGVSAFESRTVASPRTTGPRSERRIVDETRFLEAVEDPKYRGALEEIFETVRGLNLRTEWGSAGCSIRVRTEFRAEPITVAWLFPPGRLGWMGLTDVTLGFDPGTAGVVPEAKPMLERYVAQVAQLRSVEPARPQDLKAYRLSPSAVIENQSKVKEALADLLAEPTS